MAEAHAPPHDRRSDKITGDPVCGMTVDPDPDKSREEHKGHIRHSCSEDCREKCVAGPEAWLGDRDTKVSMPVGTRDTRRVRQDRCCTAADRRDSVTAYFPPFRGIR